MCVCECVFVPVIVCSWNLLNLSETSPEPDCGAGQWRHHLCERACGHAQTLKVFPLSSCSECTPAPWADVHDHAPVCPFLVLSKEFNGKVYSLSVLFWFLLCFIVSILGFKDYWRMFPGCSLLKGTVCLFWSRKLKKQILFCQMCLWRYMSKFQLLRLETPVANKLNQHKCPDLLIAFVQSHFSVVVEWQRVFDPIISSWFLKIW